MRLNFRSFSEQFPKFPKFNTMLNTKTCNARNSDLDGLRHHIYFKVSVKNFITRFSNSFGAAL